jgi:hypothetical protein
MISRFTFAGMAGFLAASLFASAAPAQVRGGMRVAAAGPQARNSSARSGRGEEFNRRSRRGFFNGSGYLFAPYLYADDESDYGPAVPEPVSYARQEVSAQPAQPPAPIPAPPLLLEIRDGQWVRVPTGGEMELDAQTGKPDGVQTSSLHTGITESAVPAAPLPQLPPAVIVFRDGHTEEVPKYMIRGAVLYVSPDYWSTGSTSRQIPLAEVDIPASLKLNKERGTKFSLPSGPNEVVVRF